MWNDRSDMGFDDLIVAGSGFTGADTPLAPVYLAYGHAEGGHDSVYLFLGQTFLGAPSGMAAPGIARGKLI